MKGIPNNRPQLRELYPHPRHLLCPGNYKRARKNGPGLRAGRVFTRRGEEGVFRS